MTNENENENATAGQQNYEDAIPPVDLTFKMDSDRIAAVCSVNDIAEADAGNLKAIMKVVASSVWDVENEKYVNIDKAIEQVGEMSWAQMNEVLSASLNTLTADAGTSKKSTA